MSKMHCFDHFMVIEAGMVRYFGCMSTPRRTIEKNHISNSSCLCRSPPLLQEAPTIGIPEI